jgi:hypothetical protein
LKVKFDNIFRFNGIVYAQNNDWQQTWNCTHIIFDDLSKVVHYIANTNIAICVDNELNPCNVPWFKHCADGNNSKERDLSKQRDKTLKHNVFSHNSLALLFLIGWNFIMKQFTILLFILCDSLCLLRDK